MTTSRRRFLLVLVLPVVATGLLVACGGDDDSSDDSTPPDLSPVASLTIVAGTSEQPSSTGTATLTCDADTSTGTAWLAASASAACAALADADVRAAFEPVPADTACTEIYGGPDVATITGSLAIDVADFEIDASLSRVNGCEIARWDALAALLPPLVPFD